jgi:hypothetical protein
MPFRPPSVQPDFSSLFTSLSQSKTQIDNYALYQTIFFLITNIGRARDLLVQDLEDINEDLSTIFAGSFLTVEDETANFPNSRQLLPGTNITFDDTVAGERTINATGGSGGGSEWSVLTNGVVLNPELVYALGDVIMTHIP